MIEVQDHTDTHTEKIGNNVTLSQLTAKKQQNQAHMQAVVPRNTPMKVNKRSPNFHNDMLTSTTY